jgi:hypothetical protein
MPGYGGAFDSQDEADFSVSPFGRSGCPRKRGRCNPSLFGAHLPAQSL